MARKKDLIASERIRWDGYRKRGVEARWDKTFAWNDSHAAGEKFGMVWSMVTAVLNGDLGTQFEQAVKAGNTEEAIEALQDLLGAFGEANS
jgi:hypothetical protein